MTKKAFVIVDVQKDFMDDGPVPVNGAYKLVPIINDLMSRRKDLGFDHIFATQDWHPQDHISFTTTHDKPLYCAVEQSMPDGSTMPLVLFNPHCVADTPGSALAGMSEHLRSLGVGKLVVVGVATEFCVKATVMDALQDGFEVAVVLDAIGAVDGAEGRRALQEMAAEGAVLAHESRPMSQVESVPLARLA
ncbi:hypothetical protein H632_c233p1 [Helicosporidium sp. ATCC 50920]|nr:hypothetical protein H632_c233p1 [Helicosporidium sp. ATCC 50920]|eukprot:KDD76415.1 hypothetical protein H632_c233p1 [Helicosporidium sp. ATCC 50920]